MIFTKIRCLLQPKNINQFEEFEVGEAQNKMSISKIPIMFARPRKIDSMNIRFSTKMLCVLKDRQDGFI